MNINYNISYKERTIIFANAMAMSTEDRALTDMDFRFGLEDMRTKLQFFKELDSSEERDFMTAIEFMTMSYAIDAKKEGFFGAKFREKTRNALLAHYTSPLDSGSRLPIIPELLH